MIPNPILKVLSTLTSRHVRHLLMGGQACVFYGAAEFSRVCDVVVLAEEANFDRLNDALDDLGAGCIAVPPFEPQYLDRGHAVHFRCTATGCEDMRLDVMTKMRGCRPFAELWDDRLEVETADGVAVSLLGIADLVQAKKTQCEKDWPMIRRLVEAHYTARKENPSPEDLKFWFSECRTPEILIRLAASQPLVFREVLKQRRTIGESLSGSRSALQAELDREQAAEQKADLLWWQPLKRELEMLRLRRPRA